MNNNTNTKDLNLNKNNKNNKKNILVIFLIIFLIFLAFSYLGNFPKGKKTGEIFFNTILGMLKIIPFAFILIGLFEVWIDRKTVIKHLGKESGIKAYFWSFILASFTVGGLFTAFPLASSLRKKGASLKVIFTYLGFSGIVRLPMTIFEITFLGLSFTITRLLVTIPMFLFVGLILGSFLDKSNFEFNNE